ncbi:DUF4232 domain-containing protein [Frondihabitans australicus]|uniref:Uncharacterized protein DUF4232 n=1 Tax=Frondihabitans australicus TaxID=386892 RepID=A0A495IGR7_9MICO|nr:DUF4232 domain-containing protein [Frondihabitans australicus]RKR74959.1 uncharacterized protein DUF4232 [Frondihabitans australicus]
MNKKTWAAAIAVPLLAVATLAGCTGSPAPEPTATKTVIATAPANTTPATTGPTATSTPSPGATAVGMCTTAHLKGTVTVAADQAGVGADSKELDVNLTNIGPGTCTLQGFPGVSFVGGGDGKQIGAAAIFNQDPVGPTVTLAVGQTAFAPMSYFSAADLPQCQAVAADGFRIYPPGQKASLFAAYSGLDGCSNTSNKLLQLDPLRKA